MKTSLRSFLIVGLIFFAAWALNVRLQWRSEPLIEAISAWSQGMSGSNSYNLTARGGIGRFCRAAHSKLGKQGNGAS